jgi:hypothetical protein
MDATMKRPIQIIAGVVGTVLLAVLAWSMLSSREALIHAQATIKAQNEVIAQAEARTKTREKEWEKQQEQFADTLRRVQTPQQVVREIPKYLELPRPIVLEQPPARLGEPLPPPEAKLDAEQLKALFDFSVQCKACTVESGKLKADLADAAVTQQALEKQRDEAVKAAKGGGFWRRFKSGMKWFAIGAAAGAIAAAGR